MLLPVTRLSAARIRLVRQATPCLSSARFFSRNTTTPPVRLRGPILSPKPAPERQASPAELPNVTEVETPLREGRSTNTAWKSSSSATGFRRGSQMDTRVRERNPQRPGRGGPSFHQQQRDDGPYHFSQKIRKWIERNEIAGKQLTGQQVDEVIRMITTTRSDNVNAAVWNLVLALLGRQEMYDYMWKAYNQMKKRGVDPSSRTYTVMLNAYAGVAHGGIAQKSFTPATPPSPLRLRRVNAIYEHSQRHIRQYLSYAKPEAEAEDSGFGDDREGFVNEAQVNVMPTNAYLKFLGRFGLWSEMQTVFLAMDPHGPLSPDQITYATMLHTINNIDHYRRASAGREGAATLPELEVGPQARVFWDQAVRNLHPPSAGRKLDEGVALAALQCFVAGRPEDKRLAETLIPRLWGLTEPNAPTVASLAGPKETEKDTTLPRLRLDVRSATQLMSLLGRLGRTSVAAHYTTQILERKVNFDMPALRVAVHNLAAVHDVEAATGVLEQYSERWPVDVLNAVLSAARWSKDWDAALTTYRRMTFLPQGVEQGTYDGKYEWKAPNGRATDSRGRRWIRHSVEPDLQSIDLLVRAGIEGGTPSIREALNVYNFYPREKWYAFSAQGKTVDVRGEIPSPGVGTRLKIEERLELARTIERAAGSLQWKAKNKEEKEAMQRILDDVKPIIARWKDMKRNEKAAQPTQPKEGRVRQGRPDSDKESGRPWNKEFPNRRRDGEFPSRRPDREFSDKRPDREFSGRSPDREFSDRRPDREFSDRRPRREFSDTRRDGESFNRRRDGERFNGRQGREFPDRREGREFSDRREGGFSDFPRRRQGGEKKQWGIRSKDSNDDE